MFEFFMLLAFAGAAFSQLLPPATEKGKEPTRASKIACGKKILTVQGNYREDPPDRVQHSAIFRTPMSESEHRPVVRISWDRCVADQVADGASTPRRCRY